MADDRGSDQEHEERRRGERRSGSDRRHASSGIRGVFPFSLFLDRRTGRDRRRGDDRRKG